MSDMDIKQAEMQPEADAAVVTATAEDVGRIHDRAFFSVVKQFFTTLFLGFFWQVMWMEETTGCYNSVKGFKPRRPLGCATLRCLCGGIWDYVWYHISMQRVETVAYSRGISIEDETHDMRLWGTICLIIRGLMSTAIWVLLVMMIAEGGSLPFSIAIFPSWSMMPAKEVLAEMSGWSTFLVNVREIFLVLGALVVFLGQLALEWMLFNVFLAIPNALFQCAVNKVILKDRETVDLGETLRKNRVAEDRTLPPDPDAILEVRHLRKTFPIGKGMTSGGLGEVIAVEDVSFKLKRGETLGIVGESGCGKTTMGRAILKLHQPTDGQILFCGQDITNYSKREMRAFRKQMQIIFQDPYSSLPPRATVGGILSEPVKVHKVVPRHQVKDYVLNLMEQCGLRDYYYERYPHEFSGGQRQRICIARALAVNPQLVVCDEPVSALDVSIQAQIINLLKKLQKERGLTYLFISHDLSVVKFISDKIGVMYLGAMVEFGEKKDIFENPLHPYTKALFSAIPNPNPDEKMERIVLNGDIPSPANPPKGCRFHTRCPHATEKCKLVAPAYREYEPGHFAACHLLTGEES